MWNREPAYHSAAAYGACKIFAEAITKANSFESDKIREQLLKLKTSTAFGEYAVDERGFQTAHKMVLHQWQNGKKVTVWPANISDGKPAYPTPPWTKR
jgi:branched-chain amino acid transport system substrate-binding protein